MENYDRGTTGIMTGALEFLYLVLGVPNTSARLGHSES
jgi:hypothetical protein